MNWIAERWQDLAVVVVVIGALAYTARRVYRSLAGRGKAAGCEACPAGGREEFALPASRPADGAPPPRAGERRD